MNPNTWTCACRSLSGYRLHASGLDTWPGSAKATATLEPGGEPRARAAAQFLRCSSAVPVDAAQRAEYRHRDPQGTVLYELVQRHALTLFNNVRERHPLGFGLPAFVEHEFLRYLDCGTLLLLEEVIPGPQRALGFRALEDRHDVSAEHFLVDVFL